MAKDYNEKQLIQKSAQVIRNSILPMLMNEEIKIDTNDRETIIYQF